LGVPSHWPNTHYISQLESLRELSIVQPTHTHTHTQNPKNKKTKKQKKKEKKKRERFKRWLFSSSKIFYEFFGIQALRKIGTSWIYVNHTLHLFKHVLSQFFSYELIDFGYFDVDVMFILLNLLMIYIWTMYLCENHCLSNNKCSKMFVGIISDKLSWDFTRPLGSPRV